MSISIERILEKSTTAVVEHKIFDSDGQPADPSVGPTVSLKLRTEDLGVLTPIKKTVGVYLIKVDSEDLQESLNYHDEWTYTLSGDPSPTIDTNDIWVINADLNLKPVDVAYLRTKHREWFNRAVPARKYFQHDKGPTTVRNRWGEPIDSEADYVEFSVPVHCSIQLETKKSDLARFGLDEGQDGIVTFSTQVLDDIGLVPEIGDKIVFYQQEYRIDALRPGGHVAGSELALLLEASVTTPNVKDVTKG